MAQIILSAQDLNIYDGDGQDPVARTGAISINMLAKAGAQGVILGHSEIGESPEIVRSKLLTIFEKRKTNPELLTHTTLLIGDSWDDYFGKPLEQVAEIISKQLALIIKDVPQELMKDIVVGYEPKWGSRGSGHDNDAPPSPELVSVCVKALKDLLENSFGEIGKQIPVIYGGRSTPERTEQILADDNVEGLILGSACNTVQKTLDIAQAMQKAKGSKRKILHANFKAFDLPDSYEEYLKELHKLDDSFIIYLSPNYVDIRLVKSLL